MNRLSKIEELEKNILRHRHLYYQGRPEIEDWEYDKMEDELKKLHPESYVFHLVGSSAKLGKKVKHQTKMLSLDKTYDVQDLKNWIGDEEVVSGLKVDGVSCSLIYQKGKLITAKTRGDGVYGEDIWEKVLWIYSIPKALPDETTFEVRGEIYCSQRNFLELAEEMVELDLARPTSQRNIVAGLMGRKDRLEFCRHLSFYGFEFLPESGHFEKEWEKAEKLMDLGFSVPQLKWHKNADDIDEVLEKTKKIMGKGEFQIDGVVFTYNDLEKQAQMGTTSHHPRYKIAFKFPGVAKQTVIQDIEWSVSRMGTLTPVALVEPVELSGAVISRVTLHNYGLVKLFDLKKGDAIEIIRSGEVIPKFSKVVTSAPGQFLPPTQCPDCGTLLEVEAIRLICPNRRCPGRNQEAILNFIQKIGIEEISFKRLEEMIRKGLVKDIPDLYRLKVEDFLTLDKVKEKLAQKFFESIEKTKEVDLKTFLSAIGLKGGAYNKCERIVDAGFDDIEKIRNLTLEELNRIDGFAEKSSQEILKSLKSKWPLINGLLKAGVHILPSSAPNRPLLGKKFCITGALTNKRSVVEKRIRDAGGTISGSVSKNTDYLVTNEKESDSSKFVQAKKLKIPILSENKLMELLENS